MIAGGVAVIGVLTWLAAKVRKSDDCSDEKEQHKDFGVFKNKGNHWRHSLFSNDRVPSLGRKCAGGIKL
jgi:hypothetical protein